MCLNWLCKYLCKYEGNIEPPYPLYDMDWLEVPTILKAEFPDAQLLLADNDYHTTTKEEFERFLEYDMTDKWKYVPELFDCDDSSFSVMGAISNPDWGALAFGIVWTTIPGGAHAINCFIDSEREVYLVEPQTDEVFKLSDRDGWKPYLVMM